jgi:biopolymer transport protein ExbD
MEDYKNEFARKIGKIRSKKLNSRVDLTAMVSVSFLLIVFFMVTTELAKPQIMGYDIPSNRGCGPNLGCNKPDENRVLTILLGDNDKIVVYSGLLAVPLEVPKEIKYGKYGIRKELLNKNKTVLEYSAKFGRPKRGVTVIIKPGKKCNYKNLVDILDEMQITDISSYAIVNDFTPDEAKLLASK